MTTPGASVAAVYDGAGNVFGGGTPSAPSGGVLPVTILVPGPAGATAKDTPNVTAAITKLTAAGGGATLLFQDGVYQVDSNALVIRSCSNFSVMGTGGTRITQAPNTAAKPNNTAGDLLVIADCTDFRVEGLTLDGLRDTISPLTPLTATASSGQPSVTVAAGQGSRYKVSQVLSVYGGLGTADQDLKDSTLTVQSITAGGGSGGGDLVTFTTNLANSYTQVSSSSFSDGFGPYAYAGAYLTAYQPGSSNTVAGRSLHGEDQQNGLHLISCSRFVVDHVEARNLWESPIKCGTGFASTSPTDGCSQGTISNCTGYHAYDQGVSVWLSSTITVTGCTANSTGWAGMSLSASDHCTLSGNRLLNSVYRVPGTNAAGTGIAIEGGRSNHVKGNIITSPYADGMRIWTSPLQFGVTGSNNPTTSTFLAAQTAAGTSVQVSSTTHLQQGGLYSIVDGGRTEAVTVASVVDSTHVTFSEALQYAHASGVFLASRVPQDNHIEGNTIYAPLNGNGILNQTAVRTQIRGNTIKSCGLSGSAAHGINFQSTTTGANPLPVALAGNGSAVHGNNIGACLGSTIVASLSEGLTITGNRLWGTATGSSTVLDLQGITNCTITGNQIEDSGNAGNTANGIKLSSSGGTPCSRVTIAGNTVARCGSAGIIAILGDSFTITGNVVTSCGNNAGINLQGVTNSVVSGNVANSNKSVGIQLEDSSAVACQYNRVSGNTTRDDASGFNVQTGATWTQQHGIVEKGTGNNNLIWGNESDSNAVDQLTTVGAATYAWANVLSGAPSGSFPSALLPSGTSSTAGLLQLDGTAADITADGTQTAGAIGKAADGGHVHPENMPWTAADSGYLAWNWDMGTDIQGASALTNNTITLLRVNIRKAISVTNVLLHVNTGGTSLTTGQNFAGLYNSAGTLIATTADQTASWASGGIKTMALTGGPYALSAGTFVWVAALSNQSAGTNPQLGRAASQTASGEEAGLAVSAARYATNGTGTSLPSSITPASNTFIGAAFWAALS